MEDDPIFEWYEQFKSACNTGDGKQSYAVLIAFEEDIYNRALSDVSKSSPHGELEPLLEEMKLGNDSHASSSLTDINPMPKIFKEHHKDELYMILRGMEACIYNRALTDVRKRIPFSLGAADFSVALLRMRLSNPINIPDTTLH